MAPRLNERSPDLPPYNCVFMRIALTLERNPSAQPENDYVQALLGAGFRREEIVVVPPGAPIPEDVDGIVLGGGKDVDPERYGQERRPDASVEVDPRRDGTDFAALDRALRDETPTLAICRGLQVVNVALGGTLVQDIPTERPSEVPHETAEDDGEPDRRTRLEHAVQIAPGTRLAEIAQSGEVWVNSRHHQAIDRPAPTLRIAAVAPDGVIEAVELERPWLLAVQWHPENLAARDDVSREIFAAFARAVRARAAARV